MEDKNSREAAAIAGYIDIIMVILGQVSIILIFCLEELSGYLFLFAAVLNAAGLGIRARKTGRSVLPWVLTGCFFPLVIPVAGIAFMVFRRKRERAERRPAGPGVHIVIAATVFAVAAVFFDSAGFAFMCTIAGVVWALWGRPGTVTKKQKLIKVVIYVVAFALVLGMKTVNNRMSERNAGIIIEACEQYLAKNGAYPQSLYDLVPAYLPKVPPARYTVMSGGFMYHRDKRETGSSYRLTYFTEAPFGRQVYSSERKAWHAVD